MLRDIKSKFVRGTGVGLLAAAALLASTGAARAQDRHEEPRMHEGARHGFVARERLAFHERDVHRFNEVQLRDWRAGQWRNTCFEGRCGWWWLAGGQWYFYESPVYPYPLIVSDIAYEEAVAPLVVPPPVVLAPPPPAPVAAAPVYYYCDNPAGYYPAVPSCPAGFRTVPGQAR